MAREGRLFRKKPVVIEAEQWDGSVTSGHGIYDWIKGNNGRARFGAKGLQIGTLEAPADEWFTVSPNDYVIRGIKGEFYACKPDIFAETYQPWFGDGEYSCATCGLGMVEPCEHWTNFRQNTESESASGGVGKAVESKTADEKGLASRVEELARVLKRISCQQVLCLCGGTTHGACRENDSHRFVRCIACNGESESLSHAEIKHNANCEIENALAQPSGEHAGEGEVDG